MMEWLILDLSPSSTRHQHRGPGDLVRVFAEEKWSCNSSLSRSRDSFAAQTKRLILSISFVLHSRSAKVSIQERTKGGGGTVSKRKDGARSVAKDENGLGWNIAEPGPKLDYLVTRIGAAVRFVIRRSSARGNNGFAKKKPIIFLSFQSESMQLVVPLVR